MTTRGLGPETTNSMVFDFDRHGLINTSITTVQLNHVLKCS